jgi:hypothetical protein
MFYNKNYNVGFEINDDFSYSIWVEKLKGLNTINAIGSGKNIIKKAVDKYWNYTNLGGHEICKRAIRSAMSQDRSTGGFVKMIEFKYKERKCVKDNYSPQEARTSIDKIISFSKYSIPINSFWISLNAYKNKSIEIINQLVLFFHRAYQADKESQALYRHPILDNMESLSP